MSILDRFKKQKKINFNEIDTIAKAEQLFHKGKLEKLYLVPPMFGGKDIIQNIIYVPIGINAAKEKVDNHIADLLDQEKTQSYNCNLEYKDKSVIPSKLIITTGKGGKEVFKTTIEIDW
jgi:hypothetical protein